MNRLLRVTRKKFIWKRGPIFSPSAVTIFCASNVKTDWTAFTSPIEFLCIIFSATCSLDLSFFETMYPRLNPMIKHVVTSACWLRTESSSLHDGQDSETNSGVWRQKSLVADLTRRFDLITSSSDSAISNCFIAVARSTWKKEGGFSYFHFILAVSLDSVFSEQSSIICSHGCMRTLYSSTSFYHLLKTRRF